MVLRDRLVLKSAQQELARGISQMLGKTLGEGVAPHGRSIILGTFQDLHRVDPTLRPQTVLKGDGYWLKTAKVHGSAGLMVTSATDRGVLYESATTMPIGSSQCRQAAVAARSLLASACRLAAEVSLACSSGPDLSARRTTL